MSCQQTATVAVGNKMAFWFAVPIGLHLPSSSCYDNVEVMIQFSYMCCINGVRFKWKLLQKNPTMTSSSSGRWKCKLLLQNLTNTLAGVNEDAPICCFQERKQKRGLCNRLIVSPGRPRDWFSNSSLQSTSNGPDWKYSPSWCGKGHAGYGFFSKFYPWHCLVNFQAR